MCASVSLDNTAVYMWLLGRADEVTKARADEVTKARGSIVAAWCDATPIWYLMMFKTQHTTHTLLL